MTESKTEYQKIENIFVRDEESKKLVVGHFRDPVVKKMFDCDFPMEVTEKIDGMNIRIMWEDGALSFAGRTDKATIPEPLHQYLLNTFDVETMSREFGDKNVTLYGEGFGHKIQEPFGSHYLQDLQRIALFDVRVGHVWLLRGDVVEIARKFHTLVVPEATGCLYLREAIKYVTSGFKSDIARDEYAEGVVCKPCCGVLDRLGRRIAIKIKRRDFVDLEEQVRWFLA